MMRRLGAFLFGAVLAVPAAGQAATIVVPMQYGTIQAAVDAAESSDTVVLTSGVYSGEGNHSIDFRGKSVVLRSVTGAAETIIDAQATKADRRRVFHFHLHEDSAARIEEVTIQGGWAPADGLAGESLGGGVLCDSGAAPLFSGCIIRGNVAATGGGGIGCANGAGPVFRDCDITDNESIHSAPEPTGGWGGGVGCFRGASVYLQSCRINGNRGNLGGGISVWDGSVTLDSCDLRNNLAPYFVSLVPPSGGNGGAMLLNDARGSLHWCTLAENFAEARPSAGGRGGAVAAYFSSLELGNCTLHRNTSQSAGADGGLGAGIYCSFTSPSLRRCIISFNHDGEAIYCIDSLSQPVLTCSDIYGNDLGDWTGRIAGQLGTAGNVQLDPLYCPLPGYSLSLDDRSPCLPFNNSCGELIGATGLGCITTDVGPEPEAIVVPSGADLLPSCPNPFNASTLIRMRTNSPSAPVRVSVSIYNLSGQRVRVLGEDLLLTGSREIKWHGRDDQGRDLPSGVYLVVLAHADEQRSQKILLLK